MSQTYKIEVEVQISKEDGLSKSHIMQGEIVKIRKVLEDWGFSPDYDECCEQTDKWFVTFWGERSLGGRSPDEAHEELAKLLPGLITKWRCVDYDEWDEVLGVVECSECGQSVSQASAHTFHGNTLGDECCWDERFRTTE